MQGYRFYLEHETPADKRKGQHSGNVFAALLRDDGELIGHYATEGFMVSGWGGAYSHPNSAVGGTSASTKWLRDNCKRISEAKARKLHPALFATLES